jgi:NitT/TauT family transport system substrate-binding protein
MHTLFAVLSPLAKRFTLVGLLAVNVIFFSSMSYAGEKLRFGYNQWIGSAGLFIAMDQKLFAKHGVDVEFTEFPGPGDGIAAVIAGQLDAVATTSDNVIVIADKAGTSRITQVYFSDTSFGGDAIVAKSGISSIADLKGKTVAASIGQVSHLLLIKALEKEGLTESDINLVNMDGEAAGAAYIAGRIDAAVTWEPWLSKGKSAGGKVIFSSADAPNLILDSIAFNTAYAQNNSASVSAFLAALDEGDQLLSSNPKKAHQILQTFFGVSESDIVEMLGGVKFYSMSKNKELFASGELLEVSQEVKDFLIGRKIIKPSLDIAPLFNASYLK